jgi:hypothetical protein
MPLIAYVPKRFNRNSQVVIDQMRAILEEYAAQGYTMTLRQGFYQMVSRGLMPNRQSEYDRLGRIVSEARLAGLLDWSHLEDRTRRLADLPHWGSPESILLAVASQYRTERWADQPERVEVWVEKEALAAVIGGSAEAQDVPWFSARGYNSQSAQWRAARRHLANERRGQRTTVIYLGDHDPSGLDMPRDIQDRFVTFGTRTQVERIALTMEQVQQFGPPPNPAKMTDSRAPEYIEQWGTESWELDALPPDVLDTLITDAIARHRHQATWDRSTERMMGERRLLEATYERWPEVTAFLDGDGDGADDGEDEF